MRLSRAVRPILVALCVIQAAAAQKIVRLGDEADGFRLIQTDIAVLDSDERRTDLDCTVDPLDPKLEYDLTFQAGYVARVPLSELAGNGDRLRILFRIQPVDGSGEPVYFREGFDVPAIDEDAEGSAPLPGKYRLGPGKYRVDWLMRDRAERVCAHTWEINADGPELLESLAAAPNRHQIDAFEEEPFWLDPPIRRSRGPLLHVKLMVSFSPVDPAKVSLSEYDQRSVVSMLRAISREPDIGEFSVVAYNAHEERVIYESERTPSIAATRPWTTSEGHSRVRSRRRSRVPWVRPLESTPTSTVSVRASMSSPTPYCILRLRRASTFSPNSPQPHRGGMSVQQRSRCSWPLLAMDEERLHAPSRGLGVPAL